MVKNHKSREIFTNLDPSIFGVKLVVNNIKLREKITILNPPKKGSISSEKISNRGK